jgi:hypothetical protein
MSARSAADVAAARRASAPLEVALFAIGFCLAGLVIMALLWSGTGPYADLARDNGVTSMMLISHGPPGDIEVRTDLPALVELHRVWSTYVTGGEIELPTYYGRSPWTAEEYAHMADTKRVFDVAKLMVPVGLFVMIIRLRRAMARGGGAAALAVARDGSLAAAAVVAGLGVASIVAFEPLFLLFHQLFFPQGNYLFDPATSNLVRLYPDWYWEGITLRVGLSFVGLALAVALATTVALRRAK